MAPSTAGPTFVVPAINRTFSFASLELPVKYLHTFYLSFMALNYLRERDHSQYFELPDQEDNQDTDSYDIFFNLTN